MLPRQKRTSPRRAATLSSLVEKALAHGPEGLSAGEKTALLKSPAALAELHQKIWRLDDDAVSGRWGLPPG